MITRFDAQYKYSDYFKFEGDTKEKTTLLNRVGCLIDSSWRYSRHWNTEKPHWVEQAKESLIKEMDLANERILQLKEAERLLNTIVPYLEYDKG